MSTVSCDIVLTLMVLSAVMFSDRWMTGVEEVGRARYMREIRRGERVRQRGRESETEGERVRQRERE